jgi:hypothetical protein
MNRVLEPELMTDAEQALAYAAADFRRSSLRDGERPALGRLGAARGYFPTLKRKWQISPSCTS